MPIDIPIPVLKLGHCASYQEYIGSIATIIRTLLGTKAGSLLILDLRVDEC